MQTTRAQQLSMRHHLSSKEVELDRGMSYAQSAGFKPVGLWYQVDRDWERFCNEDEWNQENLVVTHILELDISKVLLLRSVEDIFQFTDDYKDPNNKYPHLFTNIDWVRVSQEYSGIEIAPYQWECRLNQKSQWYYTWDCASGCVWDLDVIMKFYKVDV